MSLRSLALGVLALAQLPLLTAQSPGSPVLIKDARIVTAAGPVIDKGSVLIRNGLIADVGPSVQAPAGAWVIEGAGLTVYPGLIDALSSWGLPSAAPTAGPAGASAGARAQAQPAQPRSRGPEDRPQTSSWVRAADLVQASDRRLDTARSAGFTTAVTFPKDGIVAGHGAAINLGGATSGAMVLDASTGLYVAMRSGRGGGGGGFPSSLMGVMAYVRQLWMDAQWYKSALETYEKNPQAGPRPAYDRAAEGVLAARRVLLPASSRVEIARMITFSAALKTPVVLYGGHEAFRSVDLIKAANLPVIVNVKWPTKERDADPEFKDTYRTLETRDKAPSSPVELAKAGVPFAFTSDGLDSPADLVKAVKKSIDAGLKKEDAIAALTINAARIYSLDRRIGSIETGKIANLAVVKGDLFDASSKVEMVFIDGVKYAPAPEAPAPAGGAPGGGRRPGDAAENNDEVNR
ncbi:MAG: amidohydrolase family protein [Bryobacteraceae bacterium]|nr:amidohydrolase family protein [Bryobacteraceae bacterium]